MNQPFHARLELDKGTVVREGHDFALKPFANRIAVARVDPRVGLELLEAERDPFGLRIELQHLDLDLVSDLEHLARVVHPPPGHVRHVQQPVDPTEVDEGTIVRDVLDHSVDNLAHLQGLQSGLAQLLALLLQQGAP